MSAQCRVPLSPRINRDADGSAVARLKEGKSSSRKGSHFVSLAVVVGPTGFVNGGCFDRSDSGLITCWIWLMIELIDCYNDDSGLCGIYVRNDNLP
jgi:hypothetical protein